MVNDHVRSVVISALDKAAGLLDRPIYARDVLAGRDVDLGGLDLDSLTIFEIVMELEDNLGLELDAEHVARQPTLSALVAFLEASQGTATTVVRV